MYFTRLDSSCLVLVEGDCFHCKSIPLIMEGLEL